MMQGSERIEAVCRAKPLLMKSVLGTADIAEQLTLFQEGIEALGLQRGSVSAVEASIGLVATVTIGGERQVVKVLAGVESADRDRIDACRNLMHGAACAGVPAPQRVTDTVHLGQTIFAADSYLPAPPPRTPTSANERTSMAEALQQIVATSNNTVWRSALWTTQGFGPDEQTWPTLHDPAFDVAGTADDARWIEAVALDVKHRALPLIDSNDSVVAHTDFSAQNVRLTPAGSVAAIYDWDSLMLMPEPVLLGMTSMNFKYRHGAINRVPTPAERRNFISAYEVARGASFTPDEHVVINAAAIYALTYGARCEMANRLHTGPRERVDALRQMLDARELGL